MDYIKCKNCGIKFPAKIINKYNGYCKNCYQKKSKKTNRLIRKIIVLIAIFSILSLVIELNKNIQEKGNYIMWIIIIFVILFIIIIVQAVKANRKEQDTLFENKEKTKDYLEGYNISKNISFVRSGIGNSEIDVKLDTEKQEVLICYYFSGAIHKIPFREIIECEVIEDKNTVMKGGVGRAIVGGALAGGAGAIVGANTRASKNMIYNLQIRIVTSNINNSLYTINIINNSTGVDVNSYEYKNGSLFANEVYATIISIINQNNKQEDKEILKEDNIQKSCFEQLEQLNGLKEKGIITQDEFETKKRELLNKI